MPDSGLAIQTVDLIIIIGYLLGIMCVGILVGYKKKASSEEFFLAGTWWAWLLMDIVLVWSWEILSGWPPLH